MEDSNQLLHFLTAATSNLQEALSKPSNGKKVNHRKYIQKRLQKRDTKSNRKTKSQPTSTTATPATVSSTVRHQPVATMPSQSMYWPPVTSYYHTASTSSTPPLPSSSSSSSSISRPPSCPQQPSSSYDPDFESLLTEIGLDCPSPQYSDSNPSQRGTLSRESSLNTVNWETYLPSDYIPSPPSDFSDIEDSAYSSPCNPSPVYYPIQSAAPSPSSCYQHHVATASCEWLPTTTCGTSTTGPTILPPSLLNITPTLAPSLNELLELVTP